MILLLSILLSLFLSQLHTVETSRKLSLIIFLFIILLFGFLRVIFFNLLFLNLAFFFCLLPSFKIILQQYWLLFSLICWLKNLYFCIRLLKLLIHLASINSWSYFVIVIFLIYKIGF